MLLLLALGVCMPLHALSVCAFHDKAHRLQVMPALGAVAERWFRWAWEGGVQPRAGAGGGTPLLSQTAPAA